VGSKAWFTTMSFRKICEMKAELDEEGQEVRPPPRDSSGGGDGDGDGGGDDSGDNQDHQNDVKEEEIKEEEEEEDDEGEEGIEAEGNVFFDSFCSVSDQVNQINDVEEARTQERIAMNKSRRPNSKSCNVGFSSVDVREYRRLLGGSSGIVSRGSVSLGLSNEFRSLGTMGIDDYENARAEDRDPDWVAYIDVMSAQKRSRLLLESMGSDYYDMLREYEVKLQKYVRESRALTQDDPYCLQKMLSAENEVLVVGVHPDAMESGKPHVPPALNGAEAMPGMENDPVPFNEDELVAQLNEIEEGIQNCLRDRARAIDTFRTYSDIHNSTAEYIPRGGNHGAAGTSAVSGGGGGGGGGGGASDVGPGANVFGSFFGAMQRQATGQRRSARAAAAATVNYNENDLMSASKVDDPSARSARSEVRRSKPSRAKSKPKTRTKGKAQAKGKAQGRNKAKGNSKAKAKPAAGARVSQRSSSRRSSRRCSLASDIDDGEFNAAREKYEEMSITELQDLLRERNLPANGDKHGMTRRLAQAEVDANVVATVDELETDTDALDRIQKKRRRRRGSGMFDTVRPRYHIDHEDEEDLDAACNDVLPDSTTLPGDDSAENTVQPAARDDDDEEDDPFDISLSDLLTQDCTSESGPSFGPSNSLPSATSTASVPTKPDSPIAAATDSSKAAGATATVTAGTQAEEARSSESGSPVLSTINESPGRAHKDSSPSAAGASAAIAMSESSDETSRAGAAQLSPAIRSPSVSPAKTRSPRMHGTPPQGSPNSVRRRPRNTSSPSSPSPRSRRWYTLSLNELSSEMHKHGLPSSGSRVEMVQRLRDKVVTPTKPAVRSSSAKSSNAAVSRTPVSSPHKSSPGPSPGPSPVLAQQHKQVRQKRKLPFERDGNSTTTVEADSSASPLSSSGAHSEQQEPNATVCSPVPPKRRSGRSSFNESFSVHSIASFEASEGNLSTSFYEPSDDSIHLSHLEEDAAQTPQKASTSPAVQESPADQATSCAESGSSGSEVAPESLDADEQLPETERSSPESANQPTSSPSQEKLQSDCLATPSSNTAAVNEGGCHQEVPHTATVEKPVTPPPTDEHSSGKSNENDGGHESDGSDDDDTPLKDLVSQRSVSNMDKNRARHTTLQRRSAEVRRSLAAASPTKRASPAKRSISNVAGGAQSSQPNTKTATVGKRRRFSTAGQPESVPRVPGPMAARRLTSSQQRTGASLGARRSRTERRQSIGTGHVLAGIKEDEKFLRMLRTPSGQQMLRKMAEQVGGDFRKAKQLLLNAHLLMNPRDENTESNARPNARPALCAPRVAGAPAVRQGGNGAPSRRRRSVSRVVTGQSIDRYVNSKIGFKRGSPK